MNWSGFFTSTISVASQTGAYDAYAKPTYAAAREVKARVEGSVKMMRTASREDRLSSHRIFTDQVVLLTDRFWLPGDNSADVSKARVPLSITSTPSKGGGQVLYQVDL